MRWHEVRRRSGPAGLLCRHRLGAQTRAPAGSAPGAAAVVAGWFCCCRALRRSSRWSERNSRRCERFRWLRDCNCSRRFDCTVWVLRDRELLCCCVLRTERNSRRSERLSRLRDCDCWKRGLEAAWRENEGRDAEKRGDGRDGDAMRGLNRGAADRGEAGCGTCRHRWARDHGRTRDHGGASHRRRAGNGCRRRERPGRRGPLAPASERAAMSDRMPWPTTAMPRMPASDEITNHRYELPRRHQMKFANPGIGSLPLAS